MGYRVWRSVTRNCLRGAGGYAWCRHGAPEAAVHAACLLLSCEGMEEPLDTLREEILVQHQGIEEHLRELEGLARLAQEGDQSIDDPLRDCCRVLLGNLRKHLDFEETHLVPRLEVLGERGERQARMLLREHEDQRELFGFVFDRLASQHWTTQLLARQLCGFVQILRDDMMHEEDGLLSPDAFPGSSARQA